MHRARMGADEPNPSALKKELAARKRRSNPL
jgi:hypothetical protein